MNKIVEIAKANGANVNKTFAVGPYHVHMTEDQLRATVEQVCAPLVEALKMSRAGLHKPVDGDDPCSCSECDSVRLRASALAYYAALIGDKHE